MTAALGFSGQAEDDRSRGTETSPGSVDGALIAATYRVGPCIGAGASSHVFEAEHVRLGKKLAIKVLRSELRDKKAARRFRREAGAISRVCSEHVVSVVDCGELENGTPFLAMELLEGCDLRRLLSQVGALPVRRAAHIASEACLGLSDVHRAGLVHRDLKPENLFILRRSTGRDWCKILDFGVAKMEASVSTAEGVIVGTVRYMAPEQLTDSSMIGPTTDVYAIGAILFECLTGRPLVESSSVQETMFRIIHTPPRELMGSSTIPEALQDVIAACLHKSPAQRPPSASALRSRLERAVETPAPMATTAGDDDLSPPSQAVGSRSRSSWPRIAVPLATTLFGTLLGWHLAPHRTAPSEKSVPASASMSITTRSSVAVTAAPISSDAPLASLSVKATLGQRLQRRSPLPKVTSPARSSSTSRPPSALDHFDTVNPYGE